MEASLIKMPGLNYVLLIINNIVNINNIVKIKYIINIINKY